MGAGFSYLATESAEARYKVVMVGLDNAGKSRSSTDCAQCQGLPGARDSAPSPTAAYLLARAGTWET